MTRIDLRETFSRLPHLSALHERLLRAAREQFGMVFIALKPFMVNEDGSLFEGKLERPWLIFADDLEDEAVLYTELEVIARGIHYGRYTKDQLNVLEQWSKGILTVVDEVCPLVDTFVAQELNDHHLLQ